MENKEEIIISHVTEFFPVPGYDTDIFANISNTDTKSF